MAANDKNLPSKILVIDDDPSVAQGIDEPLSRYQVKVDKAATLDTALYLYNQNRYDVVLVELDFGPMPGLGLVQKWRSHDVVDKRTIAFIMLLGNKTSSSNEGLIKELGDLETLNKPFTLVQILPYLSRAMATRKRLQAYQEMKDKVLGYYEKTRDFDKAAEQVQKKLGEMGPKGLNMLYDLYEKAGRFDDALSIVTPLLDRDPTNIALLNAKGRLLMRLGRFAEAKTVLLKSDELAPQNIERIRQLADAYLETKDPDNGVKRMRELVGLKPDEPELKFEMFSKLYDKGFDEQAISFGKEQAKPMEIVRHYNNKGVLMSKDGQGAEAMVEYQRALRFYPQFKENYRIYYNIALAQMQGRTREAYLEAQKNLRKCLDLAADFEKAKNTLEQVERILAPKKAG